MNGWQQGGGPFGAPPWVTDLVKSFGGLDLGGPQRGPRARRGDVRLAVLDVLAEAGALNGYQVIQAIHDRSDGVWKPSPGSVYPTIQQLEDDRMIEGVEQDGRRLLTLTAAGQAYVAEHRTEIDGTWASLAEVAREEQARHRGSQTDLKPVIGQVMGAVWQVIVSGTEQQRAEAAEILGETRRRLYGLLAEGDPE